MAKQVIAVVGGTGGQGGGVVDALLAWGKFTVRVASRNPLSDAAKALANRGVEVVKADLLDAASLRFAVRGRVRGLRRDELLGSRADAARDRDRRGRGARQRARSGSSTSSGRRCPTARS